jgi:two-component system sensor histidine kinase SenX3
MNAVALAGIAAALVLGIATGVMITRRRLVRSAEESKVAEDDVSLALKVAEQAVDSRDLILSSMEEGILLIDAGGQVLFGNPSIHRLLGLRPESTQALSPVALRRAVNDAGRSRHLLTVEVEVGSPTRWLLGSAAPVGTDGSVLLVLRDITKEKRLDAVRQDLVANASHELKSPAAAIQAAAETIRRASVEDPAAVPRFAEQLEREAMRLSRIVSDLLDLSRLETGTMFDEPVALDEVVREEAERSMKAAREAGLALEVDSESVVVEGSGRDLALLVRNLIDNAVRYSADGGTVNVELSSHDGSAVLQVRDTGSGIPSRDLPRIFERFYRVDRARSRDTGGTGLGLSIVKHVAENHGGSVAVESELGAGSSFTVRIPAGGPGSGREGAGNARPEVASEGPPSR